MDGVEQIPTRLKKRLTPIQLNVLQSSFPVLSADERRGRQLFGANKKSSSIPVTFFSKN
jgi:hypothetical protein